MTDEPDACQLRLSVRVLPKLGAVGTEAVGAEAAEADAVGATRAGGACDATHLRSPQSIVYKQANGVILAHRVVSLSPYVLLFYRRTTTPTD